jgi:hypothetical protein
MIVPLSAGHNNLELMSRNHRFNNWMYEENTGCIKRSRNRECIRNVFRKDYREMV